jgi:hypothetical protein
VGMRYVISALTVALSQGPSSLMRSAGSDTVLSGKKEPLSIMGRVAVVGGVPIGEVLRFDRASFVLQSVSFTRVSLDLLEQGRASAQSER